MNTIEKSSSSEEKPALLVHPMVLYVIGLFQSPRYRKHQDITVAQTISWIDRAHDGMIAANKKESLPGAKTNTQQWQFECRFFPGPQKDNDEKFIHTSRLVMYRNTKLGTIKLDADLSIGNMIAYEKAALLVHENLIPATLQHGLTARLEAFTKGEIDKAPRLLEVVDLTLGKIHLPDLTITDIRLGMYNEYFGLYLNSSWQNWNDIRPELLRKYRISEDDPQLTDKVQPLVRVSL